MQPQELSN